MTSGGDQRFDDEWARQSPVREPSAREREDAARRRRWAAEDAAELQAAHRRRTQVVKTPRKARWRKAYPWLVFILLASLLIVVSRMAGWGTPRVADETAPPPGVGEQDSRILPAVTPVKTSRAYVIKRQNPDGSPVTFSPCRVWPVVVNTTNAPSDAYEQVVDAVQEVSAATGLALTVEGTTDETVAGERSTYQPDRYGDRWAPILVAWTTGDVEKGFAGHGGPTVLSLPDGSAHYVSGQVTLDAGGAFNQRPEQVAAILLHELGHVVGLVTRPIRPN